MDYPDLATRELLMNALRHRDYTSNGLIQFYKYDDRIEIMIHGGSYSRANVDNFPYVNEWNSRLVFCEIDTCTVQWNIAHSLLFPIGAHVEMYQPDKDDWFSGQ